MLTKIRSALSLLMLVAFPFLVLSLAGWFVVNGVHRFGDSGGAREVLAGLVLLGVVGWSVVAALRAAPGRLEGPELTREEQPALWALVDHLAAEMEVEGPRRIVVAPEVNAAVTEVGGHREMVVGLPLLATLTRRELASVLAHELGHYAQGHTRTTALTYRWGLLAQGVVERVPQRVLRWLFTGYYRLYWLVALSARRQHELDADDWSARLTDPATAADAMSRLEPVAQAWGVLVGSYLPLSGAAQRRPSLTDGLRSLLAADPDGWSGAEPTRSRWDSHPPTALRVERFRTMARGRTPSRDRVPASSLLSDGDRTLDDLERLMLVHDHPAGTWQDVVEGFGENASRGKVRALAGVAEALGLAHEPVLGELVELVARGHGADLVVPLLREDLPEDERDGLVPAVLADLLGAVVHLSLSAEGRARWAVSWTGPMTWQIWLGDDEGWVDADLEGLTRVSVSPEGAAALLDRLVGWKAQLDLPAPRPDDEAPVGREPAVAG